MIQTSCSELLVDTAIHDPQVAFDRFSALFAELNWETSPTLTVELLAALKAADGVNGPPIVVYDRDGNRTSIEYGDNAYIHTGFRFDSDCNQGDVLCFPIFKAAIEKLDGEMHACDGGTTYCYEEWLEDPENYLK